MLATLEPVIQREELEAEEGDLPADSLPGLRPARFKAQAKGERTLYRAILKPWTAWTRYVWGVLDLPGRATGLAADPVSPWTMTARQQAEFDRAVEWFLDAMVGHSRDVDRFRLPSTANIDVNLPIYEGKPILPGQLRTAYGVGIERAVQVVGEDAEKLLGIRNEEAQEKMLTAAFDRLSEGARLKLADVLRAENYPGGSVQDVLQRCLNEGMSPLSVARELRTKFADIKGYNWPRLARTEVSFAQNRAMVDTYEANGYRLPTVVVDGAPQTQRIPAWHPGCVCSVSIDPETMWMVPSVATTACELCQAERIAWEQITGSRGVELVPDNGAAAAT